MTETLANHSQRSINVSIYMLFPFRRNHGNKEDVAGWKLMLCMTKLLPNDSFQAVSLNRVAVLPRDGHTQTRVAEIIASAYKRKTPAPHALTRTHGGKVHPPQQAEGLGKTMTQTDKRLRPLARRRLMIARPDRVAMRARKP